MNITINIPDDKVTAIVEAFATQYQYQENIPNPDYDAEVEGSEETIPNPTNKPRFAKNVIRTFIKNVYVAGQVTPVAQQNEVAEQTLATTATSDVELMTVD